MDGHARVIQVFTVDLPPALRAGLDAALAQQADVLVQHSPGWVFGMARADVLILDPNAGAGKEAMDMLRNFRRDRSPCLVVHADQSAAQLSKTAAAQARPEICARIARALEIAQQNLDNASATPQSASRPHVA